MVLHGGRATTGRLLAPAAALAVALCGLTVPDAAARTPGSRDVPDLALVTAGDSGRTTALRSGEPHFARLWQLLQPLYPGTEWVSAAWAAGHHPPVRITVVWGLTGIGGHPQTSRPPGGDVAIERQDQLFLAEDGTPWVRTDPAPDVNDDDIRWHRAPRPVFERLDETGLLGAAAMDGAGDAPVARAGTTPDAWWAISGLAAGLALGAGGTRLIRRAAARPGAGPPRAEPCQELIDL
ncbi:hypothetical protein ACIHCM_15370 [Streptomyces sp. NPDC052023]|uniref:hypothetical protein n=1 Tax=Streptomyces sp. NPDC052023 TaxID=3365681 RepID=UPI0037CFD5C7